MKTWWTIGRLVGHVEPIVCVPGETHGDAVIFAAANYDLKPEEIVIRQVPPTDLPPTPTPSRRHYHRKANAGSTGLEKPNDDDNK